MIRVYYWQSPQVSGQPLMQHLKKRLAKGHRDAFVELYDRLGEGLYRYIASRAGCRESASDILQEVFVRLVRFHRQFKKVDNLDGYVFQVARNELVRWHKKNRPENGLPKQAGANEPAEFDSDDWIRHTLKDLESIDQEIVRLKIFSEMTFNEIAGLLNMPPATVATKYRRAIRRLEHQLTPDKIQAAPNSIQNQGEPHER